jgi:4-amino-4-deoxy-L-arabinose transferase-like glycosyltransferase
MSESRVRGLALACLAILWALAFLPGLGTSSRLTYHEALVAQGAREILASGEWSYPTIGGLPWLEKPPLPWWFAAGLGYLAGGVTETMARLPSALAAGGVIIAVTVVGTRHYGLGVGLLAAAIQTTTVWTVIRGRLAEADVLLTCLVSWAIVAFDQLRCAGAIPGGNVGSGSASRGRRGARWAFFAVLGSSALVKGIGFGAVLITLIAGLVLMWERDRTWVRWLWFPAGWALAAALALAWPVAMVAQHGPEVIGLWTAHFTDRLVQHQGRGLFASEPWWEYVPSVLGQALPWSPLAVLGACRSLRRAVRRIGCSHSRADMNPAGAGDRLLWAWSAGPLLLVSLTAVKNAHYAVCAQVPWSIWAALELVHLGNALQMHGWNGIRLCQTAKCAFAGLALAYGLVFWLAVPWFDRRGVEWAFYESASRQIPPNVPLAFLYDDWDRNAYDGALGSLPHDLAVRLFYFGRPACWHPSAISLTAHLDGQEVVEHSPSRWRDAGRHIGQRPLSSAGRLTECSIPPQVAPAFAVIGRERDLPGLTCLGCVEVLARGPTLRRDRTYLLFRIALRRPGRASAIPVARVGTADQSAHW